MAKEKKPAAEPAGETAVTLKVYPTTQQMVKKLAAMRGLDAMADLFNEPDVVDFFNQLYAAELAKETQRLQEKKRK